MATGRRKKPEVIVVRPVDGLAEEIVPGPRVRPPPWGWCYAEHPQTGAGHRYPTWDTGDHFLDEQCACAPRLDADGVMQHNSFDGRERYETNKALLN